MSSTSSTKRFTCRNFARRCARTRPSGVCTPSSTRNGTGSPSGRRCRLRRSCARDACRPRRRAAEDARRVAARRAPASRRPARGAVPDGNRRRSPRRGVPTSAAAVEVLVRRAALVVAADAPAVALAQRHRLDRDPPRPLRIRRVGPAQVAPVSADSPTSRSTRSCDARSLRSATTQTSWPLVTASTGVDGEVADDADRAARRSRSPSSSPRRRRAAGPPRRRRRRRPRP